MKVTAIITAHNEEATIGPLLERLREARPGGAALRAIRVVSSGSTDATDPIVRVVAASDPRVELIVEDRRRGKCAAINHALEGREPGEVVVLCSADVLPEAGAIERLVAAFEDPGVGMAGGRPVPTNDPKTFFGFAAYLLWAIHHRIALESPKLGEVVVFRDVVESIPEDSAVDEAALESMLTERGLKLVYVPDARIFNRGPENLREFLSQRRRISAGHHQLQRRRGYRVSTAGYGPALRGLCRELSWRPRQLCYAAATAALCVLGRWLGAWDFFVARRDHKVWDIARSTKRGIGPGPVSPLEAPPEVSSCPGPGARAGGSDFPPTRIVYAAPGLVLRPGGGPCEHVLAVVRAFAGREDVELKLVIGGALDAGVTREMAGIPDNVGLHLLEAPRGAWATTDCLALGANPLRYWQHHRSVVRLAHELREWKPDVVVERMWGFGGTLGRILARDGVRFVVEENGPPGFESRERSWTDLLRWVYLAASRLRIRGVYRRAAGVIVQSEALRQLLASRFGAPLDRIAVVPNAVDTSHLEAPVATPERRRERRGELGLPPDATVAVYCGSLDRSHLVVPVAEAWLASRAAADGGRLVVLGNGFERTELEQLAEGRPELVVRPAQCRSVLRCYLEAADLALAPYHLGVFPDRRFYYSSLKVREYLAFDLCVAATGGTAGELVEGGVNGFVVEQDEGWRGLFDHLPEREELRRMGEGGRDRVSSYTYDHVVERYVVLCGGRRTNRGQTADLVTLQKT